MDDLAEFGEGFGAEGARFEAVGRGVGDVLEVGEGVQAQREVVGPDQEGELGSGELEPIGEPGGLRVVDGLGEGVELGVGEDGEGG